MLRRRLTRSLASALAALALCSTLAQGAAIQSQQSGNWSQAVTWLGGVVPGAGDTVTIQNGHTVTVDNLTASAASLSVKGTLRMSRVASSSLTLTAGDLTVVPGGLLDAGTDADPIPAAYGAGIVLASGTAAGQYGLIVQNGGNLTLRGATRAPFGTPQASLPQNATQASLPIADVNGWKAGDVVAITRTELGAGEKTEYRVLSGIITFWDNATVSWGLGLESVHDASRTLRLVNLTRNVRIASRDRAKSSFVRSLASHTTGFYAAHAMFQELGDPSAPDKYGVCLATGAKATISSSTFRGNHVGLTLLGATDVTFTYNSVTVSSGSAVRLLNASSSTFRSNLLFGNGALYGGDGFHLSASRYQFFLQNLVSDQNGSGLRLDAGSDNNVLLQNESYLNGGDAYIVSSSSGNLLVGNSASGNGGDAFHLRWGAQRPLAANFTYANGGAGLAAEGAAGDVYEGDLGDASAPDGASVRIDSGTHATSFALRRVNLVAAPDPEEFDAPGKGLLAYGYGGELGTVRVWGDYLLSGSTLTLDYAQRVQASTASAPLLVRGSGHSASVASVSDTYALTQLVSVVYRGGQWRVDGSSSGANLVSFTGSQSGKAVPAANAQFTLNFTQGPSPQDGDRLDFVLGAATADSNRQKRLYFANAGAGQNHGRSKLTVAPGAGLVLRGTASAYTLMDRANSAVPYYTLVDSGAFTAAYATITNLDPDGLQLSGSGGVSLSSSSFDYFGMVERATGTFITARDLTSAATFYGVQFSLNRSTVGAAAAYNVRVLGADGGLSWYYSVPMGPYRGRRREYDPNGRISWDPVGPPDSPSIYALAKTSVTLAYELTDAASYVAQASSMADFSGTRFTSATASAFVDRLSPQGLDQNTNYYYRVGAIWGQTTYYLSPDPSSLSTLTTEVKNIQIKAIHLSSATLAWNALPLAPQKDSAFGYQLAASSASDFSGFNSVAVSPDPSVSTLTVTGLNPNKTYYFRAGGLNASGIPNYVNGGSAATLSNGVPPPGLPTVQGVSVSSIEVRYLAVVAEGYVLYGALDETFGGDMRSSATYGTTLTRLSLIHNPDNAAESIFPNTTYYLKIGAINMGATNFTEVTPFSTSTLALPPGNLQVGRVWGSSLTVNWVPLPSSEVEAASMTCEGYRVYASTAQNFTGTLVSSWTPNVDLSTLTLTGLQGKTTYYLRVGALNWTSVPNYGGTVSTLTLTGPPPANPAVSGIFGSSLTVSYDLVGASGYVAQASTAADFTGTVFSSSTDNPALAALTPSGLYPNTTYYLRAGAMWGFDILYASTRSASTLSDPVANVQFNAVHFTSVTMRWDALPAAPSSSTSEGYLLEASTSSDFTGILFSSSTPSVTRSTLTLTGLSAVTTYYLRVASLNWQSVADYVSAGSTRTGGNAAPTNPVPAAVYLTSATVSYGLSLGATSYVVQASTNPDFFGTLFTSVTANAALTSLTVAGLSANTTYYLRAGAIASAVASYGLTSPVSTATLPVLLSNPQSAGVFYTSATANWNALPASPQANSSEGYLLQASSTNFNGSGTVYSARTTDVSQSTLSVTGLSTSKTYYLRVGGLGWTGAASFVSAGSVVTSAGIAPASPAAFASFKSSATVAWTRVSADGYVVDASTDSNLNGTLFTASSSDPSVDRLTPSGLSANTTYYFRAGSLWGASTVYASALSTSTLPADVTNAQAVSVFITSATINWTPLPAGPQSATAEGYLLQASPAADFSSGVRSSATAGTALSTLTLTGLASDVDYRYRVGARNWNGTPNFPSTLSLHTLAGPAPTSPLLGGIWLSSAAVSYGTVGADGYAVQASTSADFSSPVSSASTGQTPQLAPLGLLPNTTYYLRAASDWGGSLLYSGTTLSSCTLAGPVSGTPSASVFITSLTVSWTPLPTAASAGSSNSAEGYLLQASTDPAFRGTLFSSAILDVSASGLALQGLAVQTTYYLRLGTLNWSSGANFRNLSAKVTLNGPVPSVPAAVMYRTSAAVSYGLVGADGYRVDASTAADFSGTLRSSTTASPALAVLIPSGLDPNTTYYLRAGALWGSTNSYASALARVTLANAPSGFQLAAVYYTSAALNWAALPTAAQQGSSSSAQGYLLQASTASDFSGLLRSSQTLSVLQSTLTVRGLNAGATYYFRVGSLNWASAANPAAGTWVRTSGGNPPGSPAVSASWLSSATVRYLPAAVQGYAVEASTDPDFEAVILSSATTNAALATLTVGGLFPNTTYYLRAGGLESGVTTYAEAFLSSPTLTNLVTGVQTAALYATSFTVSWTRLPTAAEAGSSNTAEGYLLEACQNADFSGALLSSATTNVLRNSLSVSGLATRTTYYYRVGTLAYDGRADYAGPYSTTTVAGPAPGAPAMGAPFRSSMTVTYTPVGAEVYVVDLATSADFGGTLYSSSTESGTGRSLVVEGLQNNTTYYLRAGALWDGQFSVAQAASPGSTLARPLTDLRLVAVNYTSATLDWTALPDASSGKQYTAEGYVLQASTAPDFTGLLRSSSTMGILLSTLTVRGLNAGTTYYFRAGSLNWQAASDFESSVSSWTRGSSPPSNPMLTAVFYSSATASWGLSDGDAYVLEASTDPDFTGIVVSSASPNPAKTSLAVLGLDTNTTYYFRAGSVKTGATTYASASPDSAATQAALASGLTITAVHVTSLTVCWSPLPTAAQAGSSSSAQGYLLQASPDPDFSGALYSSSTPNVSLSTLSVTGLSTRTTYYLRVGTINKGDRPGYAGALSTRTAPGLGPLNPAASQVWLTSMTVVYGPVGASGYSAEASTASDFSGTLVSSATTSPALASLSLSALSPNTTYYLRTGAWWDGAYIHSTAAAPSATLAEAPSGLQASVVFYTSATLNWAALPPSPQPSTAEGYLLQASTAPDFTGIVRSSRTFNVSLSTLTVAGLNAGVHYYFRANSLNWGSAVNPSSPVDSLTVAGTPPTNPVVAAAYESSATLTWGTVLTEAYVVEASTDPDFQGASLSSTTSNAALNLLSVTGLQKNTTYWFRVGGLESGVTTYVAAAPDSTSTLTGLAAGAHAFQVFPSSVSVSWGRLPTAAEEGSSTTCEGYLLTASTDSAFRGVLFSSATPSVLQSTLTLTGLSTRTTYYFRVGTLNWGSRASYETGSSTLTLVGPPPGNPAVFSVHRSSVMVSYSTVGAAGYAVEASTAQGFTGTVLSVTSLSPTVNALTVENLAPNTTYYLRAGALWDGAASYSSSVSTPTLARAVWDAQVYRLDITSATLNWPALPTAAQEGSSSSAQGYVLQASTASDFSGTLLSSSTANVALSTLTLRGLSSSVAYWFRVGTLNWASTPGFGDNLSGLTLAGPAPTSPSLSAVHVSSLTVAFGAVGADGYVVEASTNASFSGPVRSSASAAAPAQLSPSVFPNTTYYLRAGALWGGTTLYASLSGSTATLADLPSNTRFANVFITSAAVAWDRLPTAEEGGSSSTAEGYRLEGSTDAAFRGVVFSSAAESVLQSTLTLAGLSTQTTYYFRVASLNWAGTPSYAAVGSTWMTPGPPPDSALVYQAFPSSLSVRFSLMSADGYEVRGSTASDFSGTVLTSATETSGTLSLTGLERNTTYYFKAGALWGAATSYGTTFSSATLPNATSGFRFSAVFITSATLTWTPMPTAAQQGSTSTCEGYSLQASTAADFGGLVFSSNTADVGVTTLTVRFLPGDTTNYFRLGTLSWGGAPHFATAGSTLTLRGPAPGSQSLADVFVTSATVSYALTEGDGYRLEASTASDFSGTVLSSETPSALLPSLTVRDLLPNTTWYLRAAALWGGTPSYAPGQPVSTATLAGLAANLAVLETHVTSFTASWSMLPPPAVAGSSSSCEGYLLEASSAADFTGTIFSSASASSWSSTLSVAGLWTQKTYYLRLATRNWTGRLNYAGGVSTQTPIGPAPGWAAAAAVFPSSITVAFSTVGASGYAVEASTWADFSQGVRSSSTPSGLLSVLTVSGLEPNSTYYLRTAAVWDGMPSTAPAAPASTSTLANAAAGGQFASVFITSVTVNWVPLPAAAQQGSSNTSEGYLLQASTRADFAGVLYSSATSDVWVSTLTLLGIPGDTTFYFRVGALNWNATPSFMSAGSTKTLQGPAPAAPLVGAVDLSSVTVSYGLVGADSYRVDASTASDFSGPLRSSASFAAASLAVQGLDANTTYYLRAASLWGGTPSYAAAAPASTPTLAAIVGNLQAAVVYPTSITVNWNALPGPAYGSSNTAGGYRLEASTDAVFHGTILSSSTLNAALSTLTVRGLMTQTLYHYRVASLNWGQLPTYYWSGSTETLIGHAPSQPRPTAVFETSMTVTWGLVDAQSYVLEASTDANFTGTVLSSETPSPSVTQLQVTGMQPNSTYYVRAGALWDTTTAYTLVSTASLANLPPAPGQTLSVYFTSATVGWGRLPFYYEHGSSKTCEGYLLQASTAADFTGIVRSTRTPYVGLSTLTVYGLLSSSTYYFRVASLNWRGSPNFILAGSTYTYGPPKPGVPAYVSIGSTTLSAAYGTVAVEGYVLEASPFFDFPDGNLFSSTTWNPAQSSLRIEGLWENTSYFVRVGAFAGGATSYAEAAASTSTLARDITVFAPYVYVTTASVTWVPWTPGGAGSSDSCEGYWLEASTAASFSPVHSSSKTLSPWVNTLVLSGLNPSTTYYFRAGALNWNGVPDSITAGYGKTDAGAIVEEPAAVMYRSSAAFSYPPIAADGYIAEASTSPDFTTVRTSATDSPMLGALVVSSLDPNTTYFLRLGAIWSQTTVYALANPSPAATRPLPAAGETLAALFFTSATVHWAPLPTAAQAGASSTAEGYVLEASTAADFTGTVLSSATTGVTLSTLTVRGLAGNATYYFRVGTINWASQATYALAGSTWSAPLPAPGSPAATGVFASSATLAWTSAGAEGYSALASTASDFTGTVLSSTSNDPQALSLAVLGLSADTTYYLRALALWGSTSVYAAAGSTLTDAAVPGFAAAGTFPQIFRSSMTVAWSSGTVSNGFNPADTTYRVELATSSDYTTASSSAEVSALSVTLSGLMAQTTYYARVLAVNRGGKPSAAFVAGSTRTLTLSAPAAFAGAALGVSSLAWTWQDVEGEGGYRVVTTTGGRLSGDLPAGVVRWDELRLSTNTAYTRQAAAFAGSAASTAAALTVYTLAAQPTSFALVDVFATSVTVSWAANTNPAGTSYRIEYWTAGAATQTVTAAATNAAVTGLLSATTYYLTVRALNGDGLGSENDAVFSTATLLQTSYGKEVDPGTAQSVVFYPADGEVRLEVPAYAFASPVTLNLQEPDQFPSGSGAMTPVGSGIQVTVSPALQPVRDVLLSIGYTAAKAAGKDEKRFIIARYHESGVWTPLPSTVDTASRKVLARTNHFSLFQVMQANPSNTVDTVRAFPNPLRPSQGHTFMTFADLPADSRLRVFTLVGEFVKEFSASAAGVAFWDGTNSAGTSVASGVYYVLAEGAGEKKTFKVAVQR